MKLSKEDQLNLAETLINPPPPNRALKRAQKLYIENVVTRPLTTEELDYILEHNPEPKKVSFRQIIIQEKAPDDQRSFLTFYSEETDVIYQIRGYGSTPGEAADDAHKTFNDEDLRWFGC